MKLTAHEIIDETVEYYQNNPSSIGKNIDGSNSCLYNGPNGEKCAFSRCCTDDSRFIEGHCASGLLNIGRSKLLPQYEGHSESFWDDLQSLHDSDDNWDGNRLTEYGQNRVLRIKNIYL